MQNSYKLLLQTDESVVPSEVSVEAILAKSIRRDGDNWCK